MIPSERNHGKRKELLNKGSSSLRKEMHLVINGGSVVFVSCLVERSLPWRISGRRRRSLYVCRPTYPDAGMAFMHTYASELKFSANNKVKTSRKYTSDQ